MNSGKTNTTIGNKVTGKRNVSVKLSDVAKSVTSPIKHQGTPADSIYLREIRFGCPFCKKTGTTKAYKNLWKLRIHFQKDHGYTLSCQYLMDTLFDLVERKVLL